MKISILIMSFLWLLCFPAMSQQKDGSQVNYNQIIPPQDSFNISYVDRLVQIAWKNYPANLVAQSHYRQAKENLKQTRRSWMNNLNLSTQYNSQQNQETQAYTFTPRLGLGVSVNVGAIINLPSKVRVASEDVTIAQANINAQKLYIRAEVIRRYQAYILNRDLVVIHTQGYEDIRSTMVLIRQKFESGEVSIEEYNKALGTYGISRERKATAESNMMATKATLEELLGIGLESLGKEE